MEQFIYKVIEMLLLYMLSILIMIRYDINSFPKIEENVEFIGPEFSGHLNILSLFIVANEEIKKKKLKDVTV